MSKKIWCVLISLVLVITMLLVPSAAAVDEAVTHYTYPITSESEDWFDYSVLEKVEMLRIPDDILCRMTDEALIIAIAEYPYLCDIGLYGNSMEESLEVCRTYFSALDELLNRNTARESLKTYGVQMIEESASAADKVVCDEAFVAYAMGEIVNTVCEDTRVEISVDSDILSVATTTVTTPNGSPVQCYPRNETHTPEQHANFNQKYINEFGVTEVSTGTCLYNCHSYAWHSTSSTNQYWITDPSPYMTDGSYSRTYSGGTAATLLNSGIQYGDKIYYAGNTHSAIFVETSVSSQSIAQCSCISKWGPYGVFRHSMYNVPSGYDCSTITAWR